MSRCRLGLSFRLHNGNFVDSPCTCLQAEHIQAARAAEEAAAIARDTEFGAVTARLANDNCFAERRVLEDQSQRGELIPSAIGARSPFLADGARGGSTSTVQNRQRSARKYTTPATTYTYM